MIRDLLALDVDATKFLPSDDSTHGFDNMAGTLTLSPALARGLHCPRPERSAASRSAMSRPRHRPCTTCPRTHAELPRRGSAFRNPRRNDDPARVSGRWRIRDSIVTVKNAATWAVPGVRRSARRETRSPVSTASELVFRLGSSGVQAVGRRRPTRQRSICASSEGRAARGRRHVSCHESTRRSRSERTVPAKTIETGGTAGIHILIRTSAACVSMAHTSRRRDGHASRKKDFRLPSGNRRPRRPCAQRSFPRWRAVHSVSLRHAEDMEG